MARGTGSTRLIGFLGALALLVFVLPGVAGATPGDVTTIAGTGVSGAGPDNVAATSSALLHPAGMALTAGGGFLFADTDNNRIRAVSPTGVISTVAGTGTQGAGPGGVPAPRPTST